MADLRQRKHLFFDLDDTLWDFEKNSSEVLLQLFEEFDLARKINNDFDGFYSVYKHINNALWTQYRSGTVSKEFLRNNRFDKALKHFGHHNYAESLQINEQYLLRAPHGKSLKADCIEVLDYLKPNYQLHIITNGFKEVQAVKIDGSGLRHYFKHIVVSEEYRLTKPDEKIFRLAEALTGALPHECVMIGDNFDCDVLGALNAGWESVYFSENEHQYAGHWVGKLQHLKGLF